MVFIAIIADYYTIIRHANLYCGHKKEGIPKAMERAKEALESGKALQSFKKLINEQKAKLLTEN